MAARKKRKRAYGSGQVVPPAKPGGTWGVRVYVGGRRIRRGGIATRELAERHLAMLQAHESADALGLVRAETKRPLSDFSEEFFALRDRTHESAQTSRGIWKNHLVAHFGHRAPGDVDAAEIRRYAQAKLDAGLSPGTVRGHVALLSAIFTHLVDERVARGNPAKGLPKATMRLMASGHDPRLTPFLERLEDVAQVFRALPPPLNVAFALGAMAGLRTGEAFGIRWRSVDLPGRRLHIHEQRGKARTKDGEGRIVPILDGLFPVLAEWHRQHRDASPADPVIPPMRKDGGRIHLGTPGRHLRAALADLGLEREGLGWYEATRHTFASQWVLAGGSIEQLRDILGHYSVVMTERYAHLRPHLFHPRELGRIPLALEIGPTLGQRPASAPVTH